MAPATAGATASRVHGAPEAGRSAPSASAISLSMRRLTKSAARTRAGEAWMVRAKMAPPQGWSMPINCCITLVVVAILAPATAPYTGSAKR